MKIVFSIFLVCWSLIVCSAVPFFFRRMSRPQSAPVRNTGAPLPQHALNFGTAPQPEPETNLRIAINLPEQPQQGRLEFRTKETPKCRSRFQLDPLCPQDDDGAFCEDDEEYDEEVQQKFDELLQEQSFIKEVMDNNILTDPEPTLSIRTGGGFISEVTVCQAIERFIYPKRARNDRDEWVFVLNQRNMQQGVRVETCIRENSECVVGGAGIPSTYCRQKYIFRRMLAMDSQGSTIVPETVFLPSCCVCYVGSDFTSPRILVNDTLCQK